MMNRHPNRDRVHRQNQLEAPNEESRIVSISVESNKVAFALYDEFKNEIVIESLELLSNESMEDKINAFMNLTNPNLILVSSRLASNATLMDKIVVVQSYTTTTTTRQGEATAAADSNISPKTSTRNDVHRNGEQQQQHPSMHKIPYQILKSKAFDLNQCKMLILHKLRILTMLKPIRNFHLWRNNNNNDNQHNQPHSSLPLPRHSQSNHMLHRPTNFHSLSSIIDFESTILLKTLGSLLCHMQSTTHRLEEGSTVTVHSIRYINSSSYMKIDSVTLHALHIFATEHHPLQKRGSDKEGFSLFNLLDRTKSSWGRKCLREWMRNPLLDANEIRKRQNGVELFLEPSMKDVRDHLVNLLSKIGAVDKILCRMGKCTSVPMDFVILSKTLASFVSIFKILSGDAQNKIFTALNDCEDPVQKREMEVTVRNQLSFIHEILNHCHVSVLQDLLERITSIVDQEATIDAKDSVVIHHGFHEELDNAKESFDTLDATLSMIGSQVLQKYPNLLTVKVVFLPQVGFLIALDKRNHQYVPDTNEFPDLPPDFSYVFVQENEVFFKNIDMRRLDDEIGDLDAFIKDTESMIVSELEEDILDCEAELRTTFGALAQLDCILSFASCAADLNFVRPYVVDNKDSVDGDQIIIENGRHPLQELLLDGDFIANDTYIDSSTPLNIVTGPNFSGKSCYTRHVGLIVYMSHIGSFVPCDRAVVPITDQILARISSIETCAIPQSSYQLDLTQMATILNRSTNKSLVLIDEFGKGTSPLSGISVLTAALKKLLKIKCKVVCTTHFLEIFSLGLLKDGEDGVQVLQMAVHVPDSDDDNAIPLFKLEKGLAKSSAGLVCAKMAGVHEDVVARANEILGALKNGNQVKPIPSSSNSNSVFQPAAKAALRHFLSIDSWRDEPMSSISSLQEKIALM